MTQINSSNFSNDILMNIFSPIVTVEDISTLNDFGEEGKSKNEYAADISTSSDYEKNINTKGKSKNECSSKRKIDLEEDVSSSVVENTCVEFMSVNNSSKQEIDHVEDSINLQDAVPNQENTSVPVNDLIDNQDNAVPSHENTSVPVNDLVVNSTGITDKKPQKITLGLCLCVFILYMFTMVPFAIIDTLYPVMYTLSGFSENDLSIMKFSGLPWAFKFVFGFFFQFLWTPPRLFTCFIQLISGSLLIGFAFVPLENITGSAVVLLFMNLCAVINVVSFDAQIISIFKGKALLFETLQQSGIVSPDLILCFVSISNFDSSLFIYIGVMCILAIPMYWVIDFTKFPLCTVKDILKDLLSTLFISVLLFCYYLVTTWSDLLAFFLEELELSVSQYSILGGMFIIGVFIAYVFGPYLFMFTTYHANFVAAFVPEAMVSLLVMFLNPSTGFGVVIFVFILTGIIMCVGDAAMQLMEVEIASHMSNPTFLFAWFESIANGAYEVSAIIFPQAKKSMSWTVFWVVNIIMCLGAGVVALLVFCFVPFARDNRYLKEKPSSPIRLCGKKTKLQVGNSSLPPAGNGSGDLGESG